MSYSRRAYYHETDQMGVIHHANYVKWMEESRIHFLNSFGLSYKTMEDNGIISPVTSISIDYKSPIHFDDIVDIHVKVEEYTGVKLIVFYEFYVGEILCAIASSKHCFIKDGKIISLKKIYPQFHDSFLQKLKEDKE